MTMKKVDIAIIGGGAAGLFAAAYAAEAFKAEPDSHSHSHRERQIVVLEKMPRPGRKINITGKGRGNITNTKMWDEFSLHVHPNPNFLKSAFYGMNTSETMSFFESIGLPLSVERGNRVFPKSMRAMDVTDALVRTAKSSSQVDIVCGCQVETIEKLKEQSDNAACKFLIKTDRGDFEAEKVLIATGGLSYPSTGSTGDGYRFAESLGHTVTNLLPSLTALTPVGYKEGGMLSKFGKSLEGLQLKNVSASLVVNGAAVREEFGDLDFTDGGIEGALGFRLSRSGVMALSNGQKVSVSVDLKPSLSVEKIADRIKRESSGGNNTIRFLLNRLLPKQLIAPFLTLNRDLLNIDNGKAARALPERLKSLNFDIEGYVGYERCVVTNGGVSLKEVSQKTMESKLVSGLFFAGEVLDLDCDTGGYNLQTAFSTAALAMHNMLSR